MLNPIVLLVEDDSTVRMVMKRVLERLGYRTLAASNSDQALEICQANLPSIDLLLVDLVLPGRIKGYQLAIQLQSRKPSLKVIFSSGHDPHSFASEVNLREGVNFLGKPYSATQLQTLVSQLLTPLPEKLTTPASSPTLR